MRSLLMAGAAIMLGAAPVAATAQDMTGGTNTAQERRGYDALDTQQRAMYDSWPAENQRAYTSWPPDRQTSYWAMPREQQIHYWLLEPTQQEAFWMLTPDQRSRIYAMAPEQRTAAWDSITRQMSSASTRTGSTASTGSMSGNTQVRYVSQEVVQGGAMATQPSEYPVCESDRMDSCINPWAAGKRGPGVERPLDHWPGQPASQMNRR